jgi:hypothetical protein
MPRERLEIFRENKTKPKEKIFVLAYEGNNTEAIYFEALREDNLFNDDNIFIYSLRRPKTDTNSAPKYVFNQLKKEAKEYKLNETDELWMIIDRDQWSDIPLISSLCKGESNFYLALSNPCFEFWLLLHFKDLREYNDKTLKKIFENKRFKKGHKKTYLKKHIDSFLKGGYDDSDPQPNRFFPNTRIAINRARKLDNMAEDYPTKLGSHVYRLVEKIIK